MAVLQHTDDTSLWENINHLQIAEKIVTKGIPQIQS